tara:strand:+ start:125 stop:313 length:189 start_codon:yes stop_codon:yes gene_type:complete
MMRKQKQKEKENVGYKSSQGHQSLYDKRRSSLLDARKEILIDTKAKLCPYMVDIDLGENNGT